MSDEFNVNLLNENGLCACTKLAGIFIDALHAIDSLIPPGRERALVVTKLQEASFFAKRAIAMMPENQQ